jgi:hypothetical protein
MIMLTIVTIVTDRGIDWKEDEEVNEQIDKDGSG